MMRSEHFDDFLRSQTLTLSFDILQSQATWKFTIAHVWIDIVRYA